MATVIPAKSILKQTPQQPTPASSKSEEDAKAARNARNLDIALQHAYRIEHQKDIVAQILSNIEMLTDFPESASGPTTLEAKNFITLVSIFQPSNFDELVEERCANERCGYALCAKQPRSLSLGAAASWKLPKGAGDWCSNSCAKKALYIRTQLSETPAWERVPGQQAEIVLHEDDWRLLGRTSGGEEGKHSDVAGKVASARELASERGETTLSLRPGRVMTEMVVEKKPAAPIAERKTKVTFGSAVAIEGYEPKGITISDEKKPREKINNDAKREESDDQDSDEDDDPYGDLMQGGTTTEESELEYHDAYVGENEELWSDMSAALKTRDNNSAAPS